ncbi:MAG: RNA polymerase sigma factor WhiG [Candidatus Hydrogenedentota bacterium]|nr:MAG: RNA polymerase sigma factor WhiG [Candidatus Hydrogenedentota bacterium]
MATSEKDVLSDEEIWKRYKDTGDIEVRNQLIERYAPLVKYVAGRMAVNMPANVEFDDLVSYGIFGLIDAIEKYKPSLGYKFKTYATTRIRGGIIDELRALDWIPRSVRQKSRQLQAAYAELENRLGRAATDEEVAAELGLSMAEFEQLVNDVSGTAVMSLEDVWHVGSDDDEVQLGDTLAGSEKDHPNYNIEREEVKRILIEAIKELPPREKEVIALYYYEELTLKEIGLVLEVTESRVSQLHSKAIHRLRAKLQKNREAFT